MRIEVTLFWENEERSHICTMDTDTILCRNSYCEQCN